MSSNVPAEHAYLAATKDLVIGKVENVHNELRYGVPTNPKEERLAVLDEEETMTFETF